MHTAIHTDHLLAAATADAVARHHRAATDRAHRAARTTVRRDRIAAFLRAAARRLEVTGDRTTDPLPAA